MPHGIAVLKTCKYLWPNVRIVPQQKALCASLISVTISPDPNISLNPLEGSSRSLSEWVTTFHLLLVVIDPYTHESSWIVETAGRILRSFKGADCRGAWMVLGNEDHSKEFLGPWSSEILTLWTLIYLLLVASSLKIRRRYCTSIKARSLLEALKDGIPMSGKIS